MLNTLQRGAALVYLEAKATWSAWNDRLCAGAARAEPPTFATPADAVAYYHDQHGNPYTGDPLKGVGDFYLNPKRLAAGLLAGPAAIAQLYIDCDDVAGFYLLACRAIPGCEARIVTLIDERLVGSHVICVAHHAGQVLGLDTNGLHVLPDDTEATLCATWSGIYASLGYDYIGAVDSPYPF